MRTSLRILRIWVHVETPKGLLIIIIIIDMDSCMFMSFIIIQTLSTADIGNSCVTCYNVHVQILLRVM